MNYDDFVELYERQYATYREDLHFYAQVAQHAAGPVLEIGAGTGRVTAYLTRRGVNVTGLEPSGAMLERALERARQEKLAYTLVQGDVRTARLGQSFALVIAPFNALMHLYTVDDQLRALGNIRAHLRPGGAFVFDVFVPRFGVMNTLRHVGETFYQGEARTDVLFVQRHDATAQRLVTEYFVDTAGPDAPTRRGRFTLTQRYYLHGEMLGLLRASGFQRVQVTGDFQGGAFGADSETMVFHARP